MRIARIACVAVACALTGAACASGQGGAAPDALVADLPDAGGGAPDALYPPGEEPPDQLGHYGGGGTMRPAAGAGPRTSVTIGQPAQGRFGTRVEWGLLPSVKAP